MSITYPQHDPMFFPRWWRCVVVALSVLVLCSCQRLQRLQRNHVAPHQVAQPAFNTLPMASLPPEAFTGAPQPMCGPGGDPLGAQWRPPGIEGPWPPDEYICDGGDAGAAASVRPDWIINGLGEEDTIVHYDGLDGDVHVEPSNSVCIYAPRFNTVRKVSGLSSYHHADKAVGQSRTVPTLINQEDLLATSSTQPLQPIAEVGRKRPINQQRNVAGHVTWNEEGVIAFQDRFKAYENYTIIRRGEFEQTEKPYLADSIDAAITWSKDDGVQVILDNEKASAFTGDERVQATYTLDRPGGTPKVRIVKLASTNMAQPGDEIEFTLRYDNLGPDWVGNVTLVDNLTTRLEYIPGSSQSSREVNFSTQPNDSDSLILRWEIVDPVDVGEGGVIRFKCRVR